MAILKLMGEDLNELSETRELIADKFGNNQTVEEALLNYIDAVEDSKFYTKKRNFVIIQLLLFFVPGFLTMWLVIKDFQLSFTKNDWEYKQTCRGTLNRRYASSMTPDDGDEDNNLEFRAIFHNHQFLHSPILDWTNLVLASAAALGKFVYLVASLGQWLFK